MTLATISLVHAAVLLAGAAAGPPPEPAGAGKSWTLEGLPESKTIGTTPVTLTVKPDERLAKGLAEAAAGREGAGTVRLNLRGLDLPEKVAVRVYVNSPESDPTPAAPSDYLVGTVGGFGKPEAKDYAVDLAPALRKLAAKKAWAPGDPVVVRLVAASVPSRQPVRNPKATLDRATIELP
jgi:hypothetical protein